MKAPCSKCRKLITKGYGSVLSGLFVCATCVKKTPSIQARLAPEAARTLGAKGGSVKSKAKAEAARKNGKKGGRPRKKKNGLVPR